ncbi:MAG: trehalose-phosphatase [candidate division Zixibacteria bacterium]|nr:trehalose-phosphatase [candidate division Zixibacteria bacterium]
MQVLSDHFDLDSFFSDLKKSQKPILLLDYDGTLAPFKVKRDEAVPYPGVKEILNRILDANHTHVVVISGRRVSDISDLLKLDIQPEIWGSHGNERLLSDGSYKLAELSEKESEGLEKARKWAKEQKLDDNLEEKPAGLAFHWRGMDESRAEEIEKKVLYKWQPVQKEFNLKLLNFDGGIEIKVAGRDKGNAVRSVLMEFGETDIIAYLGDDLTDEDAFKVLQGKGLCILVRNELRETLADLWIEPPDELLHFLQRWHQVRSG